MARRVGGWWTRERVAELLRHRSAPVIVHPSGGEALRRALDRDGGYTAALTAFADSILNREFMVLGAAVPSEGPWPWHSDWRWGKVWGPGFFRRYDPYEPRAVPFDIKMPWELSRMTFVPPLLQAWVITRDRSYRDYVLEVLLDWERENPLARSVNWHPMEASMRAVGLVIVLGMLRGMREPDGDLGVVVARLATMHGEFIARTLEYTDVRANHYMANIVALLVLGLALQPIYGRARQWARIGARMLPRECIRQFYRDGVNFEGSLAYHRFVTELAMIGLIAMERAGLATDPTMRDRLHMACRYTAACRRPDGLLPNVGDNDSAFVMSWDPEQPRDPLPLLAVGGAVFGDDVLKPADARRPPASVAWILGEAGIDRWDALEAGSAKPGVTHFPEGGAVVARAGREYLWVDVGDVGLQGRGGHGHNDLGSFEFASEGFPLIVDSGCPVYTGDAELRDAFRATAAHNTVRVDGKEMARLRGPWGISNEAGPAAVEVREEADRTVVNVTHHGYRRLADPVDVRREIVFWPAERRVECTDTIRAREAHVVERFLHLDPGIRARQEGEGVVLEGHGRRWIISWSPPCGVTLATGQCSPEYGVLDENLVVVLRSSGAGDRKLRFDIAPLVDGR